MATEKIIIPHYQWSARSKLLRDSRKDVDLYARYVKNFKKAPPADILSALRTRAKKAADSPKTPKTQEFVYLANRAAAFHLADKGTPITPQIAEQIRNASLKQNQKLTKWRREWVAAHPKKSGFGFLGSIVKAAGSVVGAPIKLAAKTTSLISDAASKIPVIGSGLKGVLDIAHGPVELTARVASGERIDKAALNHLKKQVSAVKAVAPYAQMVVSMVPGIGTGIAAGIAASTALLQGQPIDQAIMAGIKGAIPGGAIGKSIFDVTSAAIDGKPIDQIALSAIPLPSEQKKALATVISVTKDIAAGKKPNLEMAEKAFSLLPDDVKKAVNITSATGLAKKAQSTISKGVKIDALKGLAKQGAALANASPVLKTGAKVIKDPKARQGFTLGIGLMSHKIMPVQVTAIRGRLNPEQKKGFDMALATRVGMVQTNKKNSAQLKNLTPEQKFGFATIAGLKNAPPSLRAPIVRATATVPQVKQGADVAIETVIKKPWWKKALNAVGITRFGEDDFGHDEFSFEFDL